MRKTTEYNTENRLTVDIEGLMAMLPLEILKYYVNL